MNSFSFGTIVQTLKQENCFPLQLKLEKLHEGKDLKGGGDPVTDSRKMFGICNMATHYIRAVDTAAIKSINN